MLWSSLVYSGLFACKERLFECRLDGATTTCVFVLFCVLYIVCLFFTRFGNMCRF